MFSELGGGYKFAQSEVLESTCLHVFLVDAKDQQFLFDEQGRQKTVKCGGAQPIFVGWPVAWESPNGNTRIGWFHMSHWRSGAPFNKDPEITFNCVCASHKFTWRGSR
jgi:hypothetical protein